MPRLLPLLLLLPVLAHAQLISGPLPADPGRRPAAVAAPAAARAAVLTLPFFDDFTHPLEGPPAVANWLPRGGAYVSNRLALRPLTRGVASLDGLNSSGYPYNGLATTTASGPTDTLTTQAIDLSGYALASNVALSFGWQSGSIVGAPNANGSGHNVSLELQFFDQGSRRWRSQWTQASTGRTTPFRQHTQAITDPRFFNAGFQFRFLATGDRTTGQDVWSVDYVLLDANRRPADTTYLDIATTTGLNSPLRRFTALPWWQYNAAPSPTELNPDVVAGLISLNASSAPPTPITWTGLIRDVPGTTPVGVWLTGSRSQATAPRRDSVPGDATRRALPVFTGPRTLRYTLALTTRETTPQTLPNDSLQRDVDFRDYYAYDDGTAENFTAIGSGNTTYEYLAYRFPLNEPDQLLGLRLAPVFFDRAAPGRNVTIFAWADSAGFPSRRPLGTATAAVPNPLPNGQTFAEIDFPVSIPVSGAFFLGFGQPRQTSAAIGLDLNNQRPPSSLFTTLNGVWNLVPTVSTPGSLIGFQRGAPMLRAVMTHNQRISATRAGAAPPAFGLYPNPARTLVRVTAPRFARATVLDALGRTAWAQPAAEAGQPDLPLTGLPPGLYFVRLTWPDGSSSTQRLAVE